MTLSAGARLGPYEVVGLVGAGGMGEVYRARDPRLRREVAIKVLPAAVASSPERLARFEREARAVAAVNHPSILTVFDVGWSPVPYVVTELLEGANLREATRRRRPGQRQVLACAVQVAEGLAAAHAKGVVHRDVKPENVFVTADGRVKVLDFGLGKLLERSGASSSTRPGDTRSAAGTAMGTVAYMSPEQVKGLAVDERTDIFSLGIVLYELLGGRHPFRRETNVATLTAILDEEPEELSSLGRGVSPALGGIVSRCLRKQREDRFSSARDLGFALEAILHAPAGAGSLLEAEERSPYPGLASFTEKDAAEFFGREQEVRALWERVRNRRLLAVIAPSGAGKTSLVRAGVMAACPDGWAVVCATPGAQPALGIAQALTPELAGDPEAVAELLRGVRELMETGEAGRVVAAARRWRNRHAEALLVVDQFEELFTLNAIEAQARFAALLGRLTAEADLHVLLSLRDDFLIRCSELAPLAPVFESLTPLAALSRDGLRRAIVEPAKTRGYAFEDAALVEEMLASVEGARGALPLLAFAVARLWERRDRERKLLSRAAYEEIGGVAGALAQHAEETLDRIGLAREPVVRELFRNLVTAQGTRAAADREELLSALPSRLEAETVLRALVDARLLTSYELEGGDGGGGARHRVEVVHESLLKAWPRLVRWQAQDEEGAVLRDQLKQAAHLWHEKGRTSDVLWTGTAFREFELWRDRYPGHLTALEEEYAAAMVNRARRRRRLLVGTAAAAFLALSAVATTVAISRQEAVAARNHSEASRLVALAELAIRDDPTEALAFATASLELADNEEARTLATKALWAGPPAFDLPTNGQLQWPAFSPDGRFVSGAGFDDVAVAWSDDGREVARLAGHGTSPLGGIAQGWIAPDRLAAGGRPLIHVWSVPAATRLGTIDPGANVEWRVYPDQVQTLRLGKDPSGREWMDLGSWPLPYGPPRELGRVDLTARATPAWDLSRDALFYARGSSILRRGLPAGAASGDAVVGVHVAGVVRVRVFGSRRERLWSLDRSGAIRVWSFTANGLEQRDEVRRPETSPDAVELSEDARLAWSVSDRRLNVWRTVAWPGAEPLTLRRSGSWYMASAAIEPRGRWAAAGSGSGRRFTFWSLGRSYPTIVKGYTSIYRPATFSPDGRWLATSWSDNRIRLWPMPGTGPREPRIVGAPGELWSRIAFDPRGRYLFAVGVGDEARIVPLDGSPPRQLPVYSAETVLFDAAVSPSGRRVATAFGYGKGEKTLRVHDVETGETRVFPLPPPSVVKRPDGSTSVTGYERGVRDLAFADEDTLYTAGDGGVRRWRLSSGHHDRVWVPASGLAVAGFRLSASRRTALVTVARLGGLAGECLLAPSSTSMTAMRRCFPPSAARRTPSAATTVAPSW
jgi:hypothetical protein